MIRSLESNSINGPLLSFEKDMGRARLRMGDARGFTVIESSVATVIVGLLIVAAVNTVGAARLSERKNALRARGHMLAQELMTEILQRDYEDPDTPTTSLGPTSAEESTSDRSLFNDVDDYDQWEASPPQARDGTDITGLDTWKRSVKVQRVRSDDIKATTNTEMGIKRIRVEVYESDVLVAEIYAYRTSAWQGGLDRRSENIGVSDE